jgi:Tfp pilus assembly protein PilF/O-antigen ligase
MPWPLPFTRPSWTVIYFALLLYFTLFDQTAFIPSIRSFSVALMLVIFVPWLVAKIKQPGSWPASPLDFLFGLVILTQLVSAWFSPAFRLTWYNLWLVLCAILSFYFWLDQLRAGRENFVWPALLSVVTLVLLLALLEFLLWYLGLLPSLGFEISWPAIAGWNLPPNPRRLGLALLTAPVSPPFSAYVALFIPLAVGLALSTRRLFIRLGLTGFILFGLVILMLSFSRTGLVTLGVGLVTLLGLASLTWRQAAIQPAGLMEMLRAKIMIARKNWRAKWFIPVMVLVIPLFISLLFFNWTYFRSEVFENRSGSNQIRLALLQAALQMWQDYPWLGIGPGLFGHFYRNYIPPNSFFLLNLSAHSFYFQLLAEGGLVGIALTAWLAIVTIRAGYQTIQTPKASALQWRLIGATAASTGYFVSAAIEQLWWLPFLIPVSLIAAYLVQPVNPAYTRSSLSTKVRVVWLPLTYLLLLLTLGIAWLWVNMAADRLVSVTQQAVPGQELATATELARLQQFDPGLPVYTIGQGYYLGQHLINRLGITPCNLPPAAISAADQALLTQAIQFYQAGLQPVKAHPLFWANLAALAWLNHQPEQAQLALTQAINLSITDDDKLDIYDLNSGCYYELQGQTDQALIVYSRLLQRNPALVSSGFWQSSSFRRANLSRIIQLAIDQSPDRHGQFILAIQLAQATDAQEKTTELIEQLYTTYPNSPEAKQLKVRQLISQNDLDSALDMLRPLQDFQLLGEVALAQGDTAIAQLNFQKELFIQPDNAEARLQLAHIAFSAGNPVEAISYLQRLTRAYQRPDTNDSRFIYGYPANFPIYDSLLIITPMPLQGQPFALLTKIYQDNNQVESISAVQQALLTYDPYLSAQP